MKEFLVVLREPDGRTLPHTESDIAIHQENWKQWMIGMQREGKLISGRPLTLKGKIIRKNDDHLKIIDGPYHKKNDLEIVGGFLVIRAEDLDEATSLITTCPIFAFDGFAEVRECIPNDVES